jgi:CBS domain-containing protein
MKVRDVMTREVQVVHPEATLAEAAQTMQRLNIGPLPVCDGDQLKGMITDRDITVRATASGLDPKTAKVQQAMTDEVVYCYDDQDVKDAAKLMQEHQLRRLVVLNHDKRLVGIVALGDIAVDADNDKMSGQTLQQVSEPAQPTR